MKLYAYQHPLRVISGHSLRYYSNGRFRAYSGHSAAISINPSVNDRFPARADIQLGVFLESEWPLAATSGRSRSCQLGPADNDNSP